MIGRPSLRAGWWGRSQDLRVGAGIVPKETLVRGGGGGLPSRRVWVWGRQNLQPPVHFIQSPVCKISPLVGLRALREGR